MVKPGDFVKYRCGKYFSLVLRIESDGVVIVRNCYGIIKRITRPENLVVIEDFRDT